MRFLWQSPLGFGQFAELPVNHFDSIGGVNGGTDVIGLLEVSGQCDPLVAPGFDHHGVLASPFCTQIIQRHFCSIR